MKRPTKSSPSLDLSAVSLLALAACASETGYSTDVLHDVSPADLRITVLESGALESQDPRRIINDIEGQTTILWIVGEGTLVKEGDKLVELDTADLTERLITQRVRFEDAQASKIRAEQELEIERNRQESLVKQAELALEISQIDVEKYLQGDYVQDKERAQADITIAEEELTRAIDKHSWSQQLAEKGYVTRTELQGDALSEKKQGIEVALSKRALGVLEEYTYRKEKRRLEASVEEAERELARARAEATAALAKAEADSRSRSAQFDLEKGKLDKYERQVQKAVLYAPCDGLVVYAREGDGGRRMGGGGDQPIKEGTTVRERQAIISLPDMSRMMSQVAIHESAVDRVREGMPAIIRVDAFPNEPMEGHVRKISTVPDSQSMWWNPDLKLYTTEITIDSPLSGRLRPGMSCSVEILVDDLKGVLAVPLQAVRDNGSDHFCYVEENGLPVVRPVAVGMHNDKMIHIREGLREGEKVFLTLKNAPRLPKPKSALDTLTPAPPPDPTASADASAMPASGPPADGERARRGERAGGSGGREGFGSMTPEEREEMRKRFEAMTPEEREAARQRFGGGRRREAGGGER